MSPSRTAALCEIVVYSTDCYVLAYRLIYKRAAGLERLPVVFLFRLGRGIVPFGHSFSGRRGG